MISQIFQKVFNDIWPMLIVFMVTITLLRFFYLSSHREKFCFHKEISSVVAIIYIWLLFEILTKNELNNMSGFNLKLFSEILRYKIGSKMFYYNVLGNIIIFIPFGYIIGEYVNPKRMWPILITTIVTSFVIEFVQLNIGRSFDIDDILLNVIGSILGYFLHVAIKAISKKLPNALRSDWFYNIIWILLIVLFGIYVLGYWSAIF